MNNRVLEVGTGLGRGVSTVAGEGGPTGRTVPGVRGREQGVAESVLCGGDGMWRRVGKAGCLSGHMSEERKMHRSRADADHGTSFLA